MTQAPTTQGQGGQRLLRTLGILGYSADLIAADYTVWLGDETARADFVGFGRSQPKDMSTATIVVEQLKQGMPIKAAWSQVAALAKSMAAPIVGLADNEHLLLALIFADGEPQQIADIRHVGGELSSDLVEQLDPRHVLELKTGARQPTLLPIDVSLLERARKGSEDKLAPRVERALSAAIDYVIHSRRMDSPRELLDRSHQLAARLVVGALTILVMRDKEGLEHLSPGALVDAVAQRHPSEFGWIERVEPAELDGLTGIVAGLGDDISFRGLDPLILSSLYENTLITDASRRKLATHYTPPGLARRMLQELPIEYLKPGERTILDPTCGSGGLLLAAHDRLRSLQPPYWDMATSHQDIAEHLRGYDTDAFAVEIARLSLLLHALPAGNGWAVTHADALDVTLPKDRRPAVVVANPPWRNTNAEGGRRAETADAFLRWMLHNLQPGGLLAIVLPVGWLTNRTSASTRDEFVHVCDLFEVWRMPKGTFTSGRMAPAVLFARKREASGTTGSVLFRRVIRPASVAAFYAGTREDEAFLAAPESVDAASGLVAGPLTSGNSHLWKRRLEAVADVVAGPQPRAGYVPRPASESNCTYLPYLRDVHAFAQISEQDLAPLRFPDDFQGGRGAVGLGRRKVLVPAASGPDTPWRLRTGLDFSGCLARNSMLMVLPKDDDEHTLLALHAYLGSVFASCWIDEVAVERNISTGEVSSIPVPAEAKVWRTLAKFGGDLLEAAHDPPALRTLAIALDNYVWEALDVPDDIKRRTLDRVAGFRSPEGLVRYEYGSVLPSESNGRRPRMRFGSTEAVRGGRVLLRISGITGPDGEWVIPPPGMPGALLRAGATFDIAIRDGQPLETARFHYQPESWVDDETLLTQPPYSE